MPPMFPGREVEKVAKTRKLERTNKYLQVITDNGPISVDGINEVNGYN